MATFRQNVFTAQEALTRAENALKQMIAPNRSDLLWGTELIPETAAPSSVAIPNLAAATRQAIEMRPELKQSDLSIEINKLDARLSRELAKPRIDAFANASLAGLSGLTSTSTTNPISGAFGGLITQLNELSLLAGVPPLDTSTLFASTVPPNLVGGYGQSWTNIGAATFPTVQVGLQFSLPIRNRTAEANAAVAVAEGKRLRALRDQAEMLIEADVRNSCRPHRRRKPATPRRSSPANRPRSNTRANSASCNPAPPRCSWFSSVRPTSSPHAPAKSAPKPTWRSPPPISIAPPQARLLL